MALIPAQTISDLLDSRLDAVAAHKTTCEMRGDDFGKRKAKGANEVSEEIRKNIIDLSARGVPPKEIAEQLGLDRKQVANIRYRFSGTIDARRKELAGQNIDGTPANFARNPEDIPDATPEAAFDVIMDTIRAERPAAVHTHMLPQEQSGPDKPGMTIRAVELKGAFADYCLMADHVELLDGGIDSVTFDRLPALVADLQEILAMTDSVVVWNPYAAKGEKMA